MLFGDGKKIVLDLIAALKEGDNMYKPHWYLGLKSPVDYLYPEKSNVKDIFNSYEVFS